MVHDRIWHGAGSPDDFLCRSCLESRLGRRLASGDFTAAPINQVSPWDTPLLAQRKVGSREPARRGARS